MHSVELTEEEIKELIHALVFTEGESQELDDKVWHSVLNKLDYLVK